MTAGDRDYGLVSIPRLLMPLVFGGNPHVVDEVRIRPSITICSLFAFAFCGGVSFSGIFAVRCRGLALFDGGRRVDFAMTARTH